MMKLFSAKTSDAFALPTVLIASIIMLTVLLSATSAVSSIRVAMDNQYYGQLAREAAEAGLARANACLKSSAYVPSWGAKPLYPNTTCAGGDPCTNSASCYVVSNGNVRTSFMVPAPVYQAGSQNVTVTSSVQLVRAANGGVFKSYSSSTNAKLSANVSFNNVTFGYSGSAPTGAFFTAIAADGTIRGLGQNNYGQLGNGTTTSTTTPTPFGLPANLRAVAAYTNFLSIGLNTFVLTNTGQVYGAGRNNYGQLGDGSLIDRSNPVQFQLPGGKVAQYIGVLGWGTFVLTTDNYVYATGLCSNGLLGTNYTIAGCTNRTTPAVVALPTPTTSDQNTIPTTNMALDRNNAYLRMNGGRIYGWGANDQGQLATGTNTPSSVPIQIGNYGNGGQPKATQVVFDGDAVYVVDDSGALKTAGFNFYGQAGSQHFPIVNTGSGKCLDNNGGDGLRVQLYACNGSPAQQWAWNADHSIKNLATNTCLDNTNWDGVSLQLHACSGTTAQMYGMDNSSDIYYWASSNCLDNANADGVTMQLHACNGSGAQKYTIPSENTLIPFELPATATGTIVKASTDQWFVAALTSTGEVWSAGLNDQGQLGNGPPFNGWASVAQPTPVKFILPNGVTAKDVYVTSYGGIGSPSSNTFVIGSDGKVYGAGSNSYGQLGNGNTTNQSTPVPMLVIDGVNIRAKQVQSGGGTTVVVTEDGKIYTVGNNSNGQLGDGTTTNSSTPYANKYTNILPVTQF
jgi:alpha-tubulin suppressor-like RCC1 family protein